MKTSGHERSGNREAPWWLIAVIVVAIVMALSAASEMAPLGALVMMAAVFAGLSFVGWRWGVDSRDGADWKPRKPGAIS
jgi:hypothetical protein